MRSTTVPSSPSLDDWAHLGRMLDTAAGGVFVVDLDGPDELDPVVVLHGFPTSSHDWAAVLDGLGRATRRVVLFDFIGFGLSDKPDRRYGIDLHANTTVEVLDALGISRCVLVTHDMGDTVGGELLARTMSETAVPADPAWSDHRLITSGLGHAPEPLDLEVTHRVIVNGSIYLDLACLTDGQQRLWSLPDEKLPAEFGPIIGGDSLAEGLSNVIHPDHQPDAEMRAALVQAIERCDGHLLLPRLIRYLDDRRRAEARYTGAIEAHPSSLAILWAQQDPVAVAAMGALLAERRPDAVYRPLEGFGHYPMIEDPARFGAALAEALSAPRAFGV